MLSIAIATKTLLDLAVVFAVMVVYKSFVGGAHARTNLVCLISSNIIFFTPIVVSKLFSFTAFAINTMYIAMFLFSMFVICYIAPADTEEIPILNSKKRTKIKIKALISLICVYIISILFCNQDVQEIILMTILLINVCTTKPIYRLYKCKYSYESEEFKGYFNKK